MQYQCQVERGRPLDTIASRSGIEPPVRIELTTARLQGGLVYIRTCSRVFAGVVTLFTATCDTFATPSRPSSQARSLLLQGELVDVDVADSEQVGAAGQVLRIALVHLFGLNLDGLAFMCSRASAHRSRVLA